MEHVKLKFLECDDLQIAASAECDTADEHPIYFPSTILCYQYQGQFNLKMNNQLQVFDEGSYFLVRKYTNAKCFKTWGVDQDGAKMIMFVMQDSYIKDLLTQDVFEQHHESETTINTVVELNATPLLKGLLSSILSYFEGNIEMDSDTAKIKTSEALNALFKSNPETVEVFREFSIPERANLVDFMNHNYMYNFPLEKLAIMSGRSLSTFNRDFRTLFKESPHKWIIKQRLQMAMQLIQGGKKASDVYVDVGFEDLAHFSKRFKSHFGVNPSEINQFIT